MITLTNFSILRKLPSVYCLSQIWKIHFQDKYILCTAKLARIAAWLIGNRDKNFSYLRLVERSSISIIICKLESADCNTAIFGWEKKPHYPDLTLSEYLLDANWLHYILKPFIYLLRANFRTSWIISTMNFALSGIFWIFYKPCTSGICINNRFLRERGLASNPKMEYQVFLCIF